MCMQLLETSNSMSLLPAHFRFLCTCISPIWLACHLSPWWPHKCQVTSTSLLQHLLWWKRTFSLLNLSALYGCWNNPFFNPKKESFLDTLREREEKKRKREGRKAERREYRQTCRQTFRGNGYKHKSSQRVWFLIRRHISPLRTTQHGYQAELYTVAFGTNYTL